LKTPHTHTHTHTKTDPPQQLFVLSLHSDKTNMTDQLHHIKSASELQELLSSTTYVAVDFYADWCGPCKAIAPTYAALAKQHSVNGQLAFAKVNVDNVQEAARTYGVSAMPTFMFFKEGKQVAVNGDALIRGADPRKLGAAAEKLGGLAKKRAAAAV
jgi:thioredoxin 1